MNLGQSHPFEVGPAKFNFPLIDVSFDIKHNIRSVKFSTDPCWDEH